MDHTKNFGATLDVCGSEVGACSMVSIDFASFLRSKGVMATTITVGEDVSNWKARVLSHNYGSSQPYHTATLAGDTVIDFTANQFGLNVKLPLITSKKEWIKMFTDILSKF